MIRAEHFAAHLTAASGFGTAVGVVLDPPPSWADYALRIALAIPMGAATAAGYALFAWAGGKLKAKVT